MSIKITGLNEVQKKLDDLTKNIESLNNSEVRFDKLFNQSFMNKYTKCETIDDFFKSGGFLLESEDDFKNIPEKKLDDHVKKNTTFNSWEEMISEASNLYISDKIGF